jgi:hypothetical protein
MLLPILGNDSQCKFKFYFNAKILMKEHVPQLSHDLTYATARIQSQFLHKSWSNEIPLNLWISWSLICYGILSSNKLLYAMTNPQIYDPKEYICKLQKSTYILTIISQQD